MKERYKSKIAVFLVLTRNIDNKTEILLQKRKNTGYMDGMYDMACSGHVEEGESMSQTVVREAKEELGIDINETDLELAFLLHPYKENYLNIFFRTNKYNGIPSIIEKDKCEELKWFDINDLPDNLIELNKNAIECIKNSIIYDEQEFKFLKQYKNKK